MLSGNWNIDQSLPFHYSDALRLITAIALITRAGWAIAICYFWGLTLNLQSIITPDLNYFDYPVLEFVVYWLLHIVAFVVPILFIRGTRLSADLARLWHHLFGHPGVGWHRRHRQCNHRRELRVSEPRPRWSLDSRPTGPMADLYLLGSRDYRRGVGVHDFGLGDQDGAPRPSRRPLGRRTSKAGDLQTNRYIRHNGGVMSFLTFRSGVYAPAVDPLDRSPITIDQKDS